MSALAYSGLPATRLEVEVTEGAFLTDKDVAKHILETIRALGVQVAMDDFGTGYSSLSYLQNFPFANLKIDQSFVRNIDINPQRRAIVRVITSLASSLGMKATAEGVETEAELDCIRAEGCTNVQGYLTGRPLSAGLASALVASTTLPPPFAGTAR